jgi:hypothetical protein
MTRSSNRGSIHRLISGYPDLASRDFDLLHAVAGRLDLNPANFRLDIPMGEWAVFHLNHHQSRTDDGQKMRQS